jgi:hypothetical protein
VYDPEVPKHLRRLDVARLDKLPLERLILDFPSEWKAAGERLVLAAKQGPSGLNALVASSQAAAAPWRKKLTQSHGDRRVMAAALPDLLAARMVRLGVEHMLQSAATGVEHGRVRLGLWSGLVIQKLLFSSGLTRKPASMTAFRALWPLVFDRRKLMPLVQQKGVYCFYSAELIEELARRIGPRECLEVAAGDGTLSRFLAGAGVKARATDDFSWAHAVTFPDSVERLDAAAALKKYRPKVVVCSFPPPGNTFEQRVLADPGVELYLVLTTRHRFAAGDWAAYEASARLKLSADARLSRQLLPPEVDPAVLVFEAGG